jgi:hypothetical protein
MDWYGILDAISIIYANLNNENPVMAVAPIGLTPRLPVTLEGGLVLIPDCDRIT